MQPKTTPPSRAANGHCREISRRSGTRAKVSNAEGPQNGKKTTKGSISEATDLGKNKPKSPNNSNIPREHEQHLPVANVVRIMRRALPSHGKVSDEAKETLQECVSEFISFITSEANAACQQEHRKTITAEDLIRSMSRLGFDHFVEPLMIYLQKLRDNEMVPMITRSNVPHGSSSEPPFAGSTVVHPQYAMFGSAGNGVYYHGSGPSMGQVISNNGGQNDGGRAGAFELGQASMGFYEPYGKCDGGQSDGGGAGASGSAQANIGFYDPYGKC